MSEYLVVAVFTTTEPPLGMDGTPSIDCTADFHAMLTVTEAENGGAFVSAYCDPVHAVEEIAELLDSAAEQFRAKE
jgi:hypothetical protein